MNPTTIDINSGDPNQIVQWLTSGGSLNSPSAIGALALAIHLFVIPLIIRVAAFYKYTLSGQNQMFAVYAVSVVICAVIGYVTKSAHNLNETFGYGALVANAAMGIHATRKVIGAANIAVIAVQEAEKDAKQVAAAMPPIPPQ